MTEGKLEIYRKYPIIIFHYIETITKNVQKSENAIFLIKMSLIQCLAVNNLRSHAKI